MNWREQYLHHRELGVFDELKHIDLPKGAGTTQLQAVVATWKHRFIADKSFHFSKKARNSDFYAKSPYFKHYLLCQLFENSVGQ